jgi:uncharacterized protein YodC (DUF2158 family)
MEPMNSFKIGDVVILNSGSLQLTVQSIEGEYIYCRYWVPEKYEFAKDHFDYRLLYKLEN